MMILREKSSRVAIIASVLLFLGVWVMAAEVSNHEEALELWANAKYGATEIKWTEDGFTVVHGHDPVASSSYKVIAKSRCMGGTFIYELLQERSFGNVFSIVMVSLDGKDITECVDETLRPGADSPEGHFTLINY